MAGDDELGATAAHAARDGVDQGFDGAARYAEYVFDADLLQVVDDQVAPFEGGLGRKRVAGRRQSFAVLLTHLCLPNWQPLNDIETPYIKTC
ncbi:hypothetical protein PG2T_05970 [Immundisolibacter cernigliae]|uniref:Uncharacterized protein n=1 Tax=Immundisolibacter cernigliae TaxID=1810504 RepID=A0A1B1YSI9_9GAMM|nr:hypothetical protein PG2T_05970 [Immundisolibacter cernigliae]